MEFLDFAKQLKKIKCSNETIAALWDEANEKVTKVNVTTRRPTNKDSEWVQIKPPSAAHGDSATFWYNATLGRFWIKLKGG